jgi:hypothetical protein
MSLTVLGPLGDTPPSLTGAVLGISTGVLGFLFLLWNLKFRARRDFTWPKLLLFCTVLLFLIVVGVVQLYEVRQFA